MVTKKQDSLIFHYSVSMKTMKPFSYLFGALDLTFLKWYHIHRHQILLNYCKRTTKNL